MQHVRFFLARIAGRLSTAALRLSGRAATTFPGLIATTLDREFLAHSGRGVETVLISGTNGKTTTTNQLLQILTAAGQTLIHNMAGSNLSRGLASAFLTRPRRHVDRGILEVDEAELLGASRQLQPKLTVLLNLFRDQMDRYGEIDQTARDWQQLFRETKTTEFLLNADDPSFGWLGYQQKRAIFFGIGNIRGQRSRTQVVLPHTADTILSPLTSERLIYHRVYFSHLGEYHDVQSDFRRPPLDYVIADVALQGLTGARFVIRDRAGAVVLRLTTPLPGIFNVYNVTAAALAALRLGVPRAVIESAVQTFHGVFGRFETIALPGGRNLTLLLVKNPVGFDLALSLIQSVVVPHNLVFGINDRVADGIDVSWLWDVDFESAHLNRARHIITTGTRRAEMALRLKYSDVTPAAMTTVPLSELLDHLLKNPVQATMCCLTYTTMLEFRALLASRGLVSQSFLSEVSR